MQESLSFLNLQILSSLCYNINCSCCNKVVISDNCSITFDDLGTKLLANL